MRILIASWIALTACGEQPRVQVSYTFPDGAPRIDDDAIRISILEEVGGGFETVIGTGGLAGAGTFELEVPEGEGLRARALIYRGDFVAILHGISEPFDVKRGEQPVEVTVPLAFPPEGRIDRAVASRGSVLLEMQARRWSSVRIGVLPKQPTHEARRPGGGPETDSVEAFSLEYPLDAIACVVPSGCPTTLFVDFVSFDGVAGETVTATVTVDVIPPSLSTRARIVGASAVGKQSRLEVRVDASEPIEDVLMTLRRTTPGEGLCAQQIGPYGCDGSGRKFTCTVGAPEQACEATYSISVTAADLSGNQATTGGAEIAIDTMPPTLAVTKVECAGGILVASGSATGATQVELRDGDGGLLASIASVSFALAGSSSTAASVAAIDGGGNEVSQPVSCP